MVRTQGEVLGPVRRGGQGPRGVTPLWRLIISLSWELVQKEGPFLSEAESLFLASLKDIPCWEVTLT